MHSIQYVLDNPAWHALISGNKELARGAGTVKHFPKEVSPFAGMQENNTANFDILYTITALDTPVDIFSVEDLVIPGSWDVLQHMIGLQMVYAGAPMPAGKEVSIVPLRDEHIPQMLALTALTNPGPFSSRTIDFGNYEGVFKEGKLVAMAGQRLHVYDYVEISAVCTHPDHTGKGYAKQLILRQIRHIHAAGGIPFLHVKSENSRAINVYLNLGFKIRKAISIFILQKKG